jgi:integrase
LNFAISQGIISLEGVRIQCEIMKRKEILKQHPYDIWENLETGYAYTYLPDKTKSSSRKQIKRKGDEKKSARTRIEDAIIEFYSNNTTTSQRDVKDITLRDLYSEWIEYKSKHTKSSSYICRISNDWFRFYDGDPISDVKIVNMTQLYIDEWIHSTIKKNNLTKKQYYNMSIILRQGLDYAVLNQYIDNNPCNQIKIQAKMFRREIKGKDSSEVFFEQDKEKLIKYCYDQFKKNNAYTLPMAIALNFYLGLRVGELVALKETDINGDYIHIQRMQVSTFKQSQADSLKYSRSGIEIEDRTKSVAGDRYIYLVPSAKKIIDLVMKANVKKGNCFDDFLFVKNGMVFSEVALISLLYRYCERIKIDKKSSHKIRKTFISKLLDGNLNINEVRKIAGHENEKTTLRNYCFNTLDQYDTEEKIFSIIDQNDHENIGNSKVVPFNDSVIKRQAIKGNQNQHII